MRLKGEDGTLARSNNNPDLPDFIHDYVKRLRHYYSLSESTIKSYRSAIAGLLKSAGVTYKELTKKHFEDRLIYMKEKKYSNKTIRGYIAACKYFYQYFLNIDINVDAPRVKEIKKVYDYVNAEEFMDIYLHMKNRTYATILLLAYTTGMRISECCDLRIESINSNPNEMLIKIDDGKGMKQRFVHLTKSCQQALTEYMEHVWPGKKKGYLFLTKEGNPVSPKKLEAALQKILIHLEIKKEITPHSLRRSFAYNHYMIYKDIIKLASILGHKNISTTMDYVSSTISTYGEHKTVDFDEYYAERLSKKEIDIKLYEGIVNARNKYNKTVSSVTKE